MLHDDGKHRCDWVTPDPLYRRYHDEEWGRPEHDDRRLFAKLILDGAQAGLSWLTILKRREHYERAYHGWDIQRIARYGERDRKRLLADAGIIRNRAKVDASIGNARAYLKILEDEGSFDRYLWNFVGHRTLRPRRRARSLGEIPTESAESREMSRALKARGFRFVGPTICYAFMQAVGMVDDHMAGCHVLRRPGKETP